MRDNGVASLIVVVGKRRSLLGVGFENMMRSWVMKRGAQQGTGRGGISMAGGREIKAQGRGMG